MKRRRFCQTMAWGTAAWGAADWAGRGTHGQTVVLGAGDSSQRRHYRWVVLYWMPYDNDLVRFGEPILEMVRDGVRSPDLAVAVQSDYWGDSHMRRRWVVEGQVFQASASLSPESSDAVELASYLDWASRTFEADHWIVAVVGHSGKINEISPDDHGQPSEARTWMDVDEMARVVSRFNRSIGERVELFFFQNCNKATIETVYEARHCGRYTLASQLLLGAPNYYYGEFFRRLPRLSNGRDAALAIMETERSDMYHTLTLIDNQAIAELPNHLNSVLPALGSDRRTLIPMSDLLTQRYSGEIHCDLVSLLTSLAASSSAPVEHLPRVLAFLRSSAIAAYKTGGELYSQRLWRSQRFDGLCGLGLFLPDSEPDMHRYQSLALAQQVDLRTVYRTIERAP